MRVRHLLALMASVSAFAVTAPAFAADDSSSKANKVEEVVVTADKRAENLQVVAGSVSAKTGADLEQNKLEQLSDYAAYIPGLVISNGGSPGQDGVEIRGISPAFGTGSTFATYIDETPMGTSAGAGRANEFALDLMPFDLDRLELLRGPQGTLYGADSIAGLIKYVMKTPSTSHYDAEIGGDVGGIDGGQGLLYTAYGRVNMPIKQDEAAISISLFDRHNPGYITNTYTGQKGTNVLDEGGGRVALFWKPSETFSLKLQGMYQDTRSRDNDDVTYLSPNVVTEPDGVKVASPAGGYGSQLTENRFLLAPFTQTVQYYAATADWHPGPVDVISATSYSQTHMLQIADDSALLGPLFPLISQHILNPPTAVPVPPGLAEFELGLDLDKWTEELRVQSPHDQPVEWIVGAFATHEALLNVQKVPTFSFAGVPIAAFAPYLAYGHNQTWYDEEALFGDATWHVTPKFDITGGLRVAKNYQAAYGYTSGALGSGGVPQSDSGTEWVETWLADARYHFTPDIMGYVRAGTGYRPGAPSGPPPILPPGFPPLPTKLGSEILTNYELGLKSEFWDHKALVNISVYDIQWKDIQVNGSEDGIGFVTNGGLATTHGFELESQFTPVTGLTLGFNAAWTEAYITSLQPFTSPVLLLNEQLAGVPKWTASGTADYHFALAGDWTGHVGGGIRWLDSEYVTERFVGGLTAIAPAYTAVDLNASATKDRWTVLAYVRNLTNDRAVQGENVRASRLDVAVLQPLTVGVGFRAKFD